MPESRVSSPGRIISETRVVGVARFQRRTADAFTNGVSMGAG